ncbi:MAG: hypothetical protein M3N29_04185 [Chloroflexota bacterium]|nr:hypothetical protein [Chloroflexota bacterium]
MAQTPPAVPSAMPSPTAPLPEPTDPDREPANGLLEPGTYTVHAYEGTNINLRFTVPGGWSWHGWYLEKADLDSTQHAAIGFWTAEVQVYTDPCRWQGAEPDPPTGPSVRNLIDALAVQPMRGAAAPVERSAASLDMPGRWQGSAIELTVPTDLDVADCDLGQFRSWGPETQARYHQGPGQHDLVWAIDVLPSARLIVDAASFPDTPPEVLSEIESILDSIVTGHWG